MSNKGDTAVFWKARMSFFPPESLNRADESEYNSARRLSEGERDPMTLTIDLPPELEQALRLQATRSGEDLSVFVVHAIKEKIARARTFDEVCAPFARAIETSGMSEEEFDRFFEDARDEVRHEKQGTGP